MISLFTQVIKFTYFILHLCMTNFFLLYLDSSLYANHVFNVFDNDKDGKVSFEVIFVFTHFSKECASYMYIVYILEKMGSFLCPEWMMLAISFAEVMAI